MPAAAAASRRDPEGAQGVFGGSERVAKSRRKSCRELARKELLTEGVERHLLSSLQVRLDRSL